MNKTRLEAFSDGIFAIIITIMVLELKVPHGGSLSDLQPLLPVFLSYIQSFLFISNYWVNHHHLLHTAKKVTSTLMLTNLLLLFSLSLVPFATAWVGETKFAPLAVALYSVLLFVCGTSYTILQTAIKKTNVWDDRIKEAIRKSSIKGIISSIFYLLAIPIAFMNPIISEILFLGVSLMWFLPNKNIEKAVSEEE